MPLENLLGPVGDLYCFENLLGPVGDLYCFSNTFRMLVIDTYADNYVIYSLTYDRTYRVE